MVVAASARYGCGWEWHGQRHLVSRERGAAKKGNDCLEGSLRIIEPTNNQEEDVQEEISGRAVMFLGKEDGSVC